VIKMHSFKYAFITLLKNKMLIFWTFMFPIILGIFFNMAFSNIEDSEKLDLINIAIVEDVSLEQNIPLKYGLEVLSKGDNQLFNTKYVSLDKAIDLLNHKDISGYVVLGEDVKVVIKENGINETVLKNVVEEIRETSSIPPITKISANIKDISDANLSYTMIEYYTLIAMAALYGGIFGLTAINKCLANMSEVGKRVSIAPTKKSRIVFSNMLASYILQLVGLSLLFIFTILVLKVDYGANLLLVILLAMTGAFAGLSLGLFLGVVMKSNENTKLGIIIAITMLGCFLSGMMGITMKYVIDKNIPLVNKLNPASMITDGFYALYYYDTLNRYFFNVFSLVIFGAILLFIASILLRRQEYEYI